MPLLRAAFAGRRHTQPAARMKVVPADSHTRARGARERPSVLRTTALTYPVVRSEVE